MGGYRLFRKARQKKGGWVVGPFIEASQMRGVSLLKGQWVGLELVSLHKANKGDVMVGDDRPPDLG